jgi:hypothetical protein
MDTTEKKEQVKCTLCGAEFEPGENTCGGCALNRDCKTICCPNCGFGFPEESKLATWLKERIKRKRSE